MVHGAADTPLPPPPHSVILWDVNHQHGTHRGNGKASSYARLSDATPHSKGIYSLHEVNGRVLTGSKDGTCSLSTITTSSLQHTDTYDIRDKCIKTARWQGGDDGGEGSATTFACGGESGELLLYDTRGGGHNTKTILSGHPHDNGVSNVRWSPLTSHLLLSSGRSLSMALHDIRKPSAPLFLLRGHSKQTIVKGYMIYTPTFSHGGRGVTTLGHYSNCLSVYDVGSGVRVWDGALTDEGGGVRGSPMTQGGHVQVLGGGGGGGREEEEVLAVADGRRVAMMVARALE